VTQPPAVEPFLVPAGIIVAWPGTAASVPGGWVRCTALDGRYPKLAVTTATAPGTTGGNATHQHAGGSHSHNVQHQHGNPNGTPAGTLGTNTGASFTYVQQNIYSNGVLLAVQNHTHFLYDQNGPAATDASTITPDAIAADPPGYTVVWMQSDGTATGLPANCLTWWNTQTPPPFWAQHTASAGLYIRGAAAGADGGLALAGSHSHTFSSPHSHTGTATHSHAHYSGNVATYTQSIYVGNATAAGPNTSHSHGSVQSAAAAIGNLTVANAGATGATTIGPPGVKLLFVQNQRGQADQPVGILALWLGTLASIPGGWTQVTSLPVDRMLVAAQVATDVGTQAGTLGHTHAAGAYHYHGIAGAHAHTLSTSSFTLPSNADSAYQPSGSGSVNLSPDAHQHGPGTAGNTPAVTPASSDPVAVGVGTVADDRPPYVEVAVIQYGGPPTCSITSPAASAVLSGPTPSVAWTISGGRTQQDYRLTVYAADGVTVVYDSGRVVSTALGATVAPGYLVAGQSYQIRVAVDTTVGENALSQFVPVTTSWTAPPAVGSLTAQPVGGT
jgi:hypothetical protein